METSFDLIIIGAGMFGSIIRAALFLIELDRVLWLVRGKDVP